MVSKKVCPPCAKPEKPFTHVLRPETLNIFPFFSLLLRYSVGDTRFHNKCDGVSCSVGFDKHLTTTRLEVAIAREPLLAFDLRSNGQTGRVPQSVSNNHFLSFPIRNRTLASSLLGGQHLRLSLEANLFFLNFHCDHTGKLLLFYGTVITVLKCVSTSIYLK